MRTHLRLAAALLAVAGPAAAQEESPAWLTPGRPGLSAGSTLIFVRPSVSSDTAYVRTGPGGVSAPDFDWGFERGHAFWAAYEVPGGYGARVRAMVFDADPARPKPVITSPAQGTYLPAYPLESFRAPSEVLGRGVGTDYVRFRSRLRLVSTEAEATYAFGYGPWWVEVAGGVRHQAARQEYGADLNNPAAAGLWETQTLRVAREFTGFGPAAGLFVRRGLDGPWSVYGSLRGALLQGYMDESAAFSRVTQGLPGPGRQGWAIDGSPMRTISVTEVEVGLEYRMTLGWLGVVYRGGFTAHTYYGLGGPTGGSGPVSLVGGHLAVGVAF